MRTDPLKHDEQAQVGIGTMIVFIATVLVAAVAAGVLIDMSGKLQERSSRTGKEATDQVSSNFDVQSVVGKRNESSDVGLQDLQLYVTLAPGATEIDLAQLRLTIQNGTRIETLAYNEAGADDESFGAVPLRDADGSFSAASPVLTAGDLVRLDIALWRLGMEFEARDNVRLTLIPETGTQITVGFSTPSSYGVKTVIELV